MTLKCKAIVTKVLKTSKSPAFEGLEVNDIIEFSIDMSAVGSGGRGSYAAFIKCVNIRTKKQSKLSFNQIERVLKCAEFIQLP